MQTVSEFEKILKRVADVAEMVVRKKARTLEPQVLVSEIRGAIGQMSGRPSGLTNLALDELKLRGVITTILSDGKNGLVYISERVMKEEAPKQEGAA